MNSAMKLQRNWVNDDGKWTAIRGVVSKELPPGMYELIVPGEGAPFLMTMDNVQSDTLIALPGSLSEYITRAADHFWDNPAIFNEMGLLHKRGFLIEGVPGTGKTAIALMAGRDMVEKRQGIVILVSPRTPIGALSPVLRTIRDMQSDVPLMTILEDIDRHNYRGDRAPDELLSLLDGENQVAHILHLATTNFVEKLDARILNRPSRFDEVWKAQAPGKKARAAYLRKITPQKANPKLYDEMVSKSEGLMIAHLKELAIATLIFGKPIEETVERLKKLSEHKGVGFFGEEKDVPIHFVTYNLCAMEDCGTAN